VGIVQIPSGLNSEWHVIRPELRNLESSPLPVFAECIGDLSLFEIKGCVEVGLARSERVGSLESLYGIHSAPHAQLA
jgi:hypothetical protein